MQEIGLYWISCHAPSNLLRLTAAIALTSTMMYIPVFVCFSLCGGALPPQTPLLVGGKPPKPPKVKDWIHHRHWQARKIVLVNFSNVIGGSFVSHRASRRRAAPPRARRSVSALTHVA